MKRAYRKGWVGRGAIPAADLRPIIEREIALRNDDKGIGGVLMAADEIAAATGQVPGAVARRLYDVLHRNEFVTLDVADAILVGLDLQEEWHVSLGHLCGRRGNDVPRIAWCATCEEWTLGATCLWCDRRTLALETMARRSAKGTCELCGNRARGRVGGHRLCRRHETWWQKLGRPVEDQLEHELAQFELAAA